MNTKKILINISLFGLLSLTYSASAEVVECSTNARFSEYKCDVCYTGGDAPVNNNSITLPESLLAWENKLEGINQNFYKDSQKLVEIETNIGTKPTEWDETGLEWGESVIWKKYGGVDMYTVNSGKKLDIKKITKDTQINLSGIKSTSDNYFILKVPFSYTEIQAGTFEEGNEKTSNYCISYTPKISATASTTTTTTTTTAAPVATTTTTPPTTTTTPIPATTPPTTPVTPIPKPTTVTTPTTATTTPTTTTTTPVTPKPTVTPVTTTTTTPTTTTPTTTTTTPATTTTSITPPKPPVANTQTTGIVPTSTNTNTAIPAYNPSVPLNSAGNDPKLSAASKVASGPAENMYIFMAAILLSAILYPKIRKNNS